MPRDHKLPMRPQLTTGPKQAAPQMPTFPSIGYVNVANKKTEEKTPAPHRNKHGQRHCSGPEASHSLSGSKDDVRNHHMIDVLRTGHPKYIFSLILFNLNILKTSMRNIRPLTQ